MWANALGLYSWHCPIHSFWGVPCPGCGITRGLFALMQGDWAGAVKSNWLSIAVALLWIATAVVALGDVITRQSFLQQCYELADRRLRRHKQLVIVAVVVALSPWGYFLLQSL